MGGAAGARAALVNELAPGAKGQGRLPENLAHFARALRAAGLPVGPGAVIDAIAAVEAAGIGERGDFYATLHAVFVKKHEHTVIFRQAFDIFWKRRGFMEKMIALMSPMAEPKNARKQTPEAGATRVADALYQAKQEEKPKPSLELDARFTMSAHEVLQSKDFAQMSAEEIARAREEIARLTLPDDARRTRRFAAHPHGAMVDPRRSFRRSLRSGGATIDLAMRARVTRTPPIVALCDISGSMSEYSRIFLHFLHALTEKRQRVQTFLFGTRLTNVTRALRRRDVDEALALCSTGVKDWAGGTRIGATLHAFNRDWSRRVLGQGATVLLITDGLERDGVEELAREAERLHKSCRRLIWLNPLLRFDGFAPKAQGVRALLPHVDAFRAIHNLASMRDLVRALSDEREAIAPRRLLAAG
ncbi:MAG: VWA domain-containing protein [Methylobacteriaceae bacterium]|nr:VWA domain-containing protein [Methylobacteriaceae bacterium]